MISRARARARAQERGERRAARGPPDRAAAILLRRTVPEVAQIGSRAMSELSPKCGRCGADVPGPVEVGHMQNCSASRCFLPCAVKNAENAGCH